MSDYGCRWAWCRLSFSDTDALEKHVLGHIRRAIPVRRKDVPMLRRAEEGLGDSLKLSDIMVDPSSSLSHESELSKVPVLSEPGLSSLPSPPVSSLMLNFRDQNIQDDMVQDDDVCHNPTFASFNSPTESVPALSIPPSPAFSTLVRRRKLSFDTPQKRRSKDGHSVLTPGSTSTGSQLSIEGHLTQRDDEGNADDDSSSDSHTRDETGDPFRQDMSSGVPTSSPSLLPESSQQDIYQGELNWHDPPVVSQSTNQPSLLNGSANPLFETHLQPPSQLQLSFPLYHVHRPKSGPSHNETPTSSVLSLPLKTASLSGFTYSTPQRQTWYQSALKSRVSRSIGGETTPKDSRKDETNILPTGIQEQSQFLLSPYSSRSVSGSPSSRKSVFRSGTLHPVAPPLRMHSQSESPSRSQQIPPPTIAKEGVDNVAGLDQDVLTAPDGSGSWQSQDISYPPLQTQAPYQSQSLSQ